MGIAIKCILEQEVPGLPHMEGKSLAMAYCGDNFGESSGGPPADSADIITIDFGGPKQKKPEPPPPSAAEPLLDSLVPFVARDQGVEWHDAAKGLAAVKKVLAKLRAGATVGPSPIAFGVDDDKELTEGLIYDLEVLEQILEAARKARARFCLAFNM